MQALLRSAPALAAVLTIALPGCGGDGDDSAAPSNRGLAVPIGQANCADWRAGTVDQRFGAIEQLRRVRADQITGKGIRGQGSVLTDDQAYGLFEARCADPGSGGFRLYKVYAFAAGFAGGTP